MNILGISFFYHDSAACIVRDGEIINAAEKHCISLTNMLNYCYEMGRVF